MKIFASVVSVLILCIGLLVNLEIANAQGNSTHYDMKSVIDNLNKSITRLTGGNSSELLKDTIAFINKISYQMANQSEDILNKDSLNTAETIAKKIGVGFAEVLSNISGELKQGIGSN